MVLLERIIRPVVAVDTSPKPSTKPTCQQPPANPVAQFSAPPAALAPPPAAPTAPESKTTTKKGKSYNSTDNYAYKKYMTKQEVEEDTCEDNQDPNASQRVVNKVQVSDGHVPGETPQDPTTAPSVDNVTAPPAEPDVPDTPDSGVDPA